MLVVNQKENVTLLSFYKLKFNLALHKLEIELRERVVFREAIPFESDFTGWLMKGFGDEEDQVLIKNPESQFVILNLRTKSVIELDNIIEHIPL